MRKQIKDSKYVVPLAIFIFFLLVSLALPVTLVSDDKTYFEAIGRFNGNWFHFWQNRYMTYDPRLVSDTLAVFFTHHILLWRIANAISLSLVTIMPVVFLKTKILKINNIMFALSFILMLSMPLFWWYETGFIATSSVYLFSLTGALLTVWPIICIIREQRVSKILWGISIITFPLGANMELLAASLLSFYLCSTVYLILKKRHVIVHYPYLIFSIMSIIYLITSPGNKVRSSGGEHGFFSELSFFDKVRIAFSSTGRSVFLSGTLGFLLMLSLISIILIYKKKNIFKIGLSIIPVIPGIVVSGILSMAINDHYTVQLDELNNYVATMKEMFLRVFTVKGVTSISINLAILLLFVSFVVSLMNIFDKKSESLAVLAVVGTGMATKAVMAFSPTVWISGQRTNIFLYFSFMIATLMIAHHILMSISTDHFKNYRGSDTDFTNGKV